LIDGRIEMKRMLIPVFLLAAIIGGSAWALWPRGERGLILYTAVDYGPAVAQAFTHATGMPVTVVRLTTGALLAKISAEGHRPAWALAWFDGDLAAVALDRAGLVSRHTVPSSLPWTEEGRSLVPADGSYTPTGLTLAGAFTYQPAVLAHPPSTWMGLLAPGLHGAIGMNNPSISGPMYPMLAGMLAQGGGWPKGQAFVMGLKGNGLHVYAKNKATLAALREGDIKVAITQSSAAWYLAARDRSLRVSIPKPAFALPSVLVVAAGIPSQTRLAAERFIRFAMSHDMQKLRIGQGEGDSYYWPLTTDAPHPQAGMPALGSLPITHLDPERWGPIEPQVNQWFGQAIIGQ
jgi:iron(III) transport system substrate-binding protein